MEPQNATKKEVTLEKPTEEKKPSGHGALWFGLVMFGFLVLIIAVEMMRSKGD